MPSDLILTSMNCFHRAVLAASFGRIGWSLAGMPVLELTTTGRKSGKPRSVMLSSPLQEGTTIVLIASRGGDDRQPSWYLNLAENPEVKVRWKGQPTRVMYARTADPAERARLWSKVVADHSKYADYQSRTNREIPLVLLSPTAPLTSGQVHKASSTEPELGDYITAHSAEAEDEAD
jgi:deazaflavin-dependent oxidoreductase (nitroreductase family)